MLTTQQNAGKRGHKGSYIYCWWECPLIHNFWLAVQSQILKITGEALPMLPKVFLLNLWPHSLGNTNKLELIGILLADAYLAIKSKWKDSSPPTITLWLEKT